MADHPDLVAATWCPWMGREYGLRPSDLESMTPGQLNALLEDAAELNKARQQ